MDFKSIIDKYYPEDNKLRWILITHSTLVMKRAVSICDVHPELGLDRQFITEAAMLHDIGIFRCNAPGICCTGTEPYIRHGILGAELLRAEGLPRHARVAERHTGTGITVEAIRQQGLPLPLRDYSPETIEEQIVCYADKFFSKTHLERERTPQQVLQSLAKFGPESVARMQQWMSLFS